jgi:hypothetical protein
MLIMEEEGSEQQLVKSAAAANVLGISKTTLNRLAPIYEQVHGELPRGGRHVRLWPLEAIERIQSARLAVKERRAESIEAALGGASGGTARPPGSCRSPKQATNYAT